MTVAELIEKLKEMNQTATVVSDDMFDIDKVVETTLENELCVVLTYEEEE